MGNIVKVVLLLVVFASISYAAVSQGRFNDPKNPGKCTIKENLILSPGQQIKDPNADCARIICVSADGHAEFHTCGKEIVRGCILGDYINKSLPYPQCCKRERICT